MIEDKNFLGAEFATWLWYYSETKEGKFELKDNRTCQIDFEKDLVLRADAGEVLNSALRGDAPSLAPEAAAALAAGKTVRRARVSFAMGNMTWQFTLNAETFDFGGLKLDTPPSLPFEEGTALRLSALQEFHDVFSELYHLFLDLRLDTDAWKAEERHIRAWVKRKQKGEPTEEE
jgi:hypothetical protein